MHDINRKPQPASWSSETANGRVTQPDEISLLRTLDGSPQAGNGAFDVPRFDKSVVRDKDINRDFQRKDLERGRNKSWVNKWADE